jgi:hypothetical protein
VAPIVRSGLTLRGNALYPCPMDAASSRRRVSFRLVGVARVLLILNLLLFAYVTWFLLPIDAHTPLVEHLRISAGFFAVCCAVSFSSAGGRR